MKAKWFIVLMLVFLPLALVGQQAFVEPQPPDWATRTFAAPSDRVFAASLVSINAQHHEIKTKDAAAHTVDFHVGVTAWSWGYNMRLKVTSVDENHSEVVVGLSKSGGDVFSWGSGKKEVRKILDGIDTELTRAQVAPRS